jgi:hypothetical protein
MIVAEWEDRRIAYQEPTHVSQPKDGAFWFEGSMARTRDLQATAGAKQG